MSKQDRQGARTTAQLEQEFQFGRSFADAMGLAKKAKDEAQEAKKATEDLDKKLDPTEIFNRLTNNGEEEALYREDGRIYFNGSYIKTGILLAELIKAGVLKSKDGETFYLDLDNGVLKGKFAELNINGKTVDEIAEDKANDAIGELSQEDVFNKLTNNGALKGIYMEDGELYINASFLMSGFINAALIKAGIITSSNGSVKVDLDNNTIEIGGLDATPETLTKLVLDWAGVFGYGKNYSTGVYKQTLEVAPGCQYSASVKQPSAITALDGVPLNISTDGGPLLLGSTRAQTKIHGSSVDISSAVNGVSEYLTPPMVAGTEYRTMERFLGEPVYTKLVDFGASSATTSNWQTNTLAHGVSGISKIIKCQGCISGSKATALPAINGGLVMVWADKINVYLYRETAYTPPSDERLYVQLWYTK